jgi:DNA-binding transcriptional LysR family regulator
MVYIFIMNTVHLSSFDLNLLVSLDALLREAHVTRAARRVGLTQSAMSHALRRLRAIFGDPLLVRSAGGLRPTPRAARLRGPLDELLRGASGLLADEAPLQPKTLERAFLVASADYVSLMLLPPLLARLAREAPRVDLVVRLPDTDARAALEEGHVEMAFMPRAPAEPGLYATKVFDERFLCAARPGHPALEAPMTAQSFAALSHVLVAPGGVPRGAIDVALAGLGLERRVALAVPQFLVAPFVVARSDLVLTAPAHMLREAAASIPLCLFEPPLEVPPFSLWTIWHERTHHDAACAWFRALVADVARAIETTPAPTSAPALPAPTTPPPRPSAKGAAAKGAAAKGAAAKGAAARGMAAKGAAAKGAAVNGAAVKGAAAKPPRHG